MIPLAAHADWSVSPAKRWMSIATPDGDGWRVTIEKVGELATHFARLLGRAGEAPVAFGVDAPIGLPLAFRRTDTDFPAFLAALTPDSAFFDVAGTAAEIGPDRPFYPRRSLPGVRRLELLDGLGFSDAEQLLRQCERRLGSQPAASPMFWTLGANQVGKGAIHLWRDLLLPAMHAPVPPLLWPFAGSMADLLTPGRVVVAECYPANAMRQMALGFQGSKRRHSDRRAVAPALRARLHDVGAEPDDVLSAKLDTGFGTGGDGEDQFDSLIGLIRMLQLIRDPALDQLPDPAIRAWEGWILGRPLRPS